MENVTFPSTGGNQTWTTVQSNTPFQLSEGIQTFRITANNSGWNINKMNLLLECAEVVIAPYVEVFNALGTLLNVEGTFDSKIFKWTTVSSSETTYLTAGTHTLRLNSNSNRWKINWIDLKGIDYVNPCELPFSNEGFEVKNTTTEWSSGLIDISCVSNVNAYIQYSSTGALSESDYLNVYYKLDGGTKVAISENSGALNGEISIVRNLSGNTLEVIIQTKSSSIDNYYTISKVGIVENTDSFGRIEAEDYDEQNGSPNSKSTSDIDGNKHLSSVFPVDWVMFKNLDLTGVNSVSTRFGSIYDAAFIEGRIGSADGTLIGTIDLYNTGGWHNWETVNGSINNVIGIHDVYFVFETVTSRNPCNVNWFQFSETSLGVEENENYSFQIYPNPVNNILKIKNAAETNVELFDSFGKLLLKSKIIEDEYELNISAFASGIYFIKINKEGKNTGKKIIKLQ